jgi:hypothetical protein
MARLLQLEGTMLEVVAPAAGTVAGARLEAEIATVSLNKADKSGW